jgi:RNA polymerase sigma factor (sigma-70 family)
MSNVPPSLHTQPSLLIRIRDHRDAAAWDTFVDTYGPLIYHHGRRRGLQDADAADLTQEVLTEVTRSIHSFEYQPQRGRFRDWLGTVTRRRLGRMFANRTNGAVSAEALAGLTAPQADSEWTAEFNGRVLRVALERIRPHFEPTTWRAFECVWQEHRSAVATADELSVPIETVYVSKSRVLKRLEEEVLLLAEDLPHCVPLG